MGSQRAPGDGAPLILMDVRPPLLADALRLALGRIGFRSTGPSTPSVAAPAAAIVTQDADRPLQPAVGALTVVLPDGQGHGGRLVWAAAPEEPLAAGDDNVRLILAAIASAVPAGDKRV
ncbi:hypothetical protein K6U06_01075 [Acidiferrimicrobium sp. IK]|uniref:hypothetical protein n=1 Tax=Acidiferrimicrobium sp. IK TaxID=2871700 RepID=UPI0021CAE71A|nr:hypothetical protein [Acidiferrimicrobium sp. IK]MCU4182939.1 hypothetical protein [Acidiferrimicrobium sp. IK]